jgi:hypothetical protein
MKYPDGVDADDYVDVEHPRNLGRRRPRTDEWSDYILDAQNEWSYELAASKGIDLTVSKSQFDRYVDCLKFMLETPDSDRLFIKNVSSKKEAINAANSIREGAQRRGVVVKINYQKNENTLVVAKLNTRQIGQAA